MHRIALTKQVGAAAVATVPLTYKQHYVRAIHMAAFPGAVTDIDAASMNGVLVLIKDRVGNEYYGQMTNFAPQIYFDTGVRGDTLSLFIANNTGHTVDFWFSISLSKSPEGKYIIDQDGGH